MIAKNTVEFIKYISSFSSREQVPLECPLCHSTFTKVKHDIQSKLGAFNNRETICCSRKCLYDSLNKSQNIICLQCGIAFVKKASEIKKTTKHFCSSSCFGIYHNAHKTFGSRRSKLEKWVELQLKQLCPGIEIVFNGTKATKSELDIYFPALKLAIEFDGIFHFKPIFGEAKFLATQNNDRKKRKICAELGIDLVKLDVSSMKKFNYQESEKYLKIILLKIKEHQAGVVQIVE